MQSGFTCRCSVLVVGVCLVLAGLGTPDLVLADFTYTDGSFGISISLPDNTSVSRIKNPAGQTGTEIAQFTLPEGNVAGRIVVSDLPETYTFEKALATVREQLATDGKVPPDKILNEKANVQGNARNATLLQAWDQEHKLLNSVLVTRGPSEQMFIMYVATHGVPREAAAKLVKQLCTGFTVLLQAKDEERMRAAKGRGPQALLDLVWPPPTPADLWDKQYLLISAGKEPYGYIEIGETLETRNKKPGLALKVERWSFWPQGGGAEYESQKAFASWDLQDDEWSGHTEVVVETQGQPLRMVTTDHNVLRLGPSLMIETTDPQNTTKLVKRVIPYPRTVIPQAWRWLLPRLMDKNDPEGGSPAAGEWIALVTYSPSRRGLETQMFSRATHGAVRNILQREGLYGVTEDWQFETGGLKQISSTDTRLVPASQGEVKRLFGTRIAQWQEKVAAQKK
jgi:hypothetical protein